MWQLWILAVLFSNVVFAKLEVCLLPSKTGPCRGRFQRYYFNAQTGMCESFIYGGCRGNANNFKTMRDCEAFCPSGDLDCELPPVTGPCEAIFQRYFWNSTSNACEQFIYGGCGGNANKFSTIKDCQTKCSSDCELPPVTGFCKAAFRKYFWNSTSNACEQFIYGGCGGNANRFSSIDDCQAKCTPDCELPPVPGPCKAAFPRYFWNSTSNACEKFIYGGCNGNANRFSSLDDCQAKCDSVCDLPIIPGNCRSNIPSYGWNTETGNCEYFVYGGCGGNDNRFTTKHNCLEMCGPPRACTLSADAGDCEGVFTRFFFNTASGSCEKFTYGGCNGNENNFETELQCVNHCKSTHSVCHLEYDSGRCGGKISSFYYNSEVNDCQRFFYGGCEGNDNRFESYDTCMDKCSPLRKSKYDNL